MENLHHRKIKRKTNTQPIPYINLITDDAPIGLLYDTRDLAKKYI